MWVLGMGMGIGDVLVVQSAVSHTVHDRFENWEPPTCVFVMSLLWGDVGCEIAGAMPLAGMGMGRSSAVFEL